MTSIIMHHKPDHAVFNIFPHFPKHIRSASLCSEDCIVKHQCEIKILGITIDFKQKYDSHVSELCRKAA